MWLLGAFVVGTAILGGVAIYRARQHQAPAEAQAAQEAAAAESALLPEGAGSASLGPAGIEPVAYAFPAQERPSGPTPEEPAVHIAASGAPETIIQQRGVPAVDPAAQGALVILPATAPAPLTGAILPGPAFGQASAAYTPAAPSSQSPQTPSGGVYVTPAEAAGGVQPYESSNVRVGRVAR